MHKAVCAEGWKQGDQATRQFPRVLQSRPRTGQGPTWPAEPPTSLSTPCLIPAASVEAAQRGAVHGALPQAQLTFHAPRTKSWTGLRVSGSTPQHPCPPGARTVTSRQGFTAWFTPHCTLEDEGLPPPRGSGGLRRGGRMLPALGETQAEAEAGCKLRPGLHLLLASQGLRGALTHSCPEKRHSRPGSWPRF